MEQQKQARLEQTILKNLVLNETFSRKVLPYIKSEYFTEVDERTVFEEVQTYFLKFSKPPTTEALLINLDNNDELSDNVLGSAKTVVGGFTSFEEETPVEWLTNETEMVEDIIPAGKQLDGIEFAISHSDLGSFVDLIAIVDSA